MTFHPKLADELRHFYQHSDFGPASPNLGGTGGGSSEQREPRLPHGANLWTLRTVMARLQAADREMGRGERLVNGVVVHRMPCASDVLHAYYGEGERLHAYPGVSRGADPITAVYPLTGLCPLHRDGERAIIALWDFAAKRAGATGDKREAWDKCHAEAVRLLDAAHEAYANAAGKVAPLRGKTLAEKTRGVLGGE